MAKKGMSEDQLLGVVDAWISDALDYEKSELMQDRAKAIDFFEGGVDFGSEPGKSSVVSHDVADTVNGILPGLLRVFTASDNVVQYEPRRRDQVEGSKQATDCINYYWWNEWDGYRVLHTSMHDGLLLRNGIIKHWWDTSKQYKTETLTGLSEEDILLLADDDTVEEVLEQRDYMVGPDGKELKEGDEGGEKYASA